MNIQTQINQNNKSNENNLASYDLRHVHSKHQNTMITQTGMCVPKNCLHNNDFPAELETNHEWIKSRTGIDTRRVAKHETTYSMAHECAKQFKFNNLRLIIVATSTPDLAFPSCASYIHSKLNLHHNVTCFDIHDACNGFVQALEVALMYIKNIDEHAEALIVGSEVMTKLLNWDDRSTAVLFGDGCGAMLINNSHGQLLYNKSVSIPQYDCLNTENNAINMNGKVVFQNAVSYFRKSLLEAEQTAANGIDWFIPHQANIRIIDSAIKNTTFDSSKVVYNGNKYGNTSAASVPIALCESFEKISPENVLLFSGFGSGLRGSSVCVKV